jgi:hypothetical protein
VPERVGNYLEHSGGGNRNMIPIYQRAGRSSSKFREPGSKSGLPA